MFIWKIKWKEEISTLVDDVSVCTSPGYGFVRIYIERFDVFQIKYTSQSLLYIVLNQLPNETNNDFSQHLCQWQMVCALLWNSKKKKQHNNSNNNSGSKSLIRMFFICNIFWLNSFAYWKRMNSHTHLNCEIAMKLWKQNHIKVVAIEYKKPDKLKCERKKNVYLTTGVQNGSLLCV